MGFGDPFHRHPLIEAENPNDDGGVNCARCELPITDRESYACKSCDYYIHKLCSNLPQTLSHPLHDQHPLTLLTTSTNAINCNECHNPCFGGFSYHCTICNVNFHLKCLFALKHEKHEHPLIFSYLGTDLDGIQISYDCNMCGFPVIRFSFACTSCRFYIHHECSLIPSTIKHWHVHDLTIRYDFPEECDQYYCDLCEDRDGELDHKLSYYYCKRCDYIGHLHCCLPQPKDDGVLIERYTHEHPLRLLREHPDAITGHGLELLCDQCDYVVHEFVDEHPSLVKHPRHPQHTLAFSRDDFLFKCTDCDFSIGCGTDLVFNHPYFGDHLRFYTSYLPFRCNACGELGKGSRMMKGINIDFHLECFALPGKLEHESHQQHPIYLTSSPMKVLSLDDTSTRSQNCDICKHEIDSELLIYRCLECDYVAHLNCGASDLLPTLRSCIKNKPDMCAIIEPNKMSFELQVAQTSSSYSWPPSPLLTELEIEEVDHLIRCPRCCLLFSTRAEYS